MSLGGDVNSTAPPRLGHDSVHRLSKTGQGHGWGQQLEHAETARDHAELNQPEPPQVQEAMKDRQHLQILQHFGSNPLYKKCGFDALGLGIFTAGLPLSYPRIIFRNAFHQGDDCPCPRSSFGFRSSKQRLLPF
eukprot:Skav205599  [mRNA]  locus=scaffold460:152433:153092:+ [translate_table: standard]